MHMSDTGPRDPLQMDPTAISVAMAAERDADRAGTFRHFEDSQHRPAVQAYELSIAQYERLKAARVYADSIRELGDPDRASEVDRLGVAMIDADILLSPDFCGDDKLRALYALELSSFFGALRESRLLISVSEEAGDEITYLDRAIKGLFITFFENPDGSQDTSKDMLSEPSVINACLSIIESARVGKLNKPNERNNRIRRQANGMVPIVRALEAEDGSPYAVYLDDKVEKQRNLGGISLTEVQIIV